MSHGPASGDATPEPPAPSPRDGSERAISVLLALGDLAHEPALVRSLVEAGFAPLRCDDLAALPRVAASSGAEAVVLDADAPAALAAVSRLRRGEGAAATVPVLLVGVAGATLRSGFDAVDVGGDAFLPRPLREGELVARLRGLLELPAGPILPSVPPPALPSGPFFAALAPAPPRPARASSVAPPAPAGGAPELAALGATAGTPVADEGAAVSPSGLSASLAEALRAAAARAGATEAELALPGFDDEALDELLPPELLEPLDAPLDALAEELGAAYTPPPYTAAGGLFVPSSGGTGAGSVGTFAGGGTGVARRGERARGAYASGRGALTPTLTPLAVAGETRLSGALGAGGVGALLGAASRARASGLLALRVRGDEFALALTAGHVLSLRSSRPQDEQGAALARLGALPREAARFATAPLDAGLRGAALLAARGYLSGAALAQALTTALRERVFDLLVAPECEWEMRALDSAEEAPLTPRALDALLVLGARARFEEDEALAALGGPDARFALRLEASALAGLPLLAHEREALEPAAGAPLAVSALAARGDAAATSVLPAALALAWLGLARVEGGAASAALAPAPGASLALERARVRALVEAAAARDHLALLGVSEWCTRAAAREALGARAAEVAALHARHAEVRGLEDVVAVLEELGKLLDDERAWGRYVAALRAPTTM